MKIDVIKNTANSEKIQNIGGIWEETFGKKNGSEQQRIAFTTWKKGWGFRVSSSTEWKTEIVGEG